MASFPVLYLIALAVAAQGSTPSKTQLAEGEQIALNICSSCHRVADKQEFIPLLHQQTPSFQEIANDPHTTAQSLRRFISTTHWDEQTAPVTMPDIMLDDDQIRAVSSYIMSLRTARSRD